MKPENAIEVNDVIKNFKIYYDKGSTIKEKILFKSRNRYENRQVLKGISFDVKKGEAIGLIGHNGCGKSTTLKLLTRIMYPDSGTIEMKGRVSSLIELGAGFHPDMSGRENIYINASILGLTRKEIDQRLDDIIAFSELEEFIDNPVRTYSSGMYMRLAFSVAINVDADILLIDEILAVGDSNFQAKCFNRLREIKGEGVTIVIVSHALTQLEQICDRGIWINEGLIEKEGSVQEVIDVYLDFMNGKQIEQLKKEESRRESLKEKEGNSEENQEGHAEEVAEESEDTTKESESDSDEEKIDYNANHFGLKYVEITKAEMINSKGEKTTIIEAGENIEIKMYYKVNKKINKYVFGVGIYSLDGRNLYGNNTSLDRIEIDSVETEGVISCKLEAIPLLSGDYNLNVAVVDENGTPMDFYRKYCTFSVISKDRSSGYFSIPHKWEV